MNLTRIRAGAFVLGLIVSGPALAQGTPGYQSGTLAAPHDLAKMTSNGQVQDASPRGVLGDNNGRGVNPFGILDSGGGGACSNSALTSGAYSALCFGHDTAGNGVISLDSYGGASNGSLLFRLNGATFPFPPSGNVSRTPADFGADPTGTADSTAALNAWAASATAANPTLTCGAGVYKFTSTLALPTALNNFSIRGAGSTQCIFKYAGAATNIDLITGGNTVTNSSGWNLTGFRIASDTTMTAGTALHLKRLSQSRVDDVYADCTDQTSNHLLWNGFWFDGIHQVSLSNFCAYGGHNGVQANGLDGTSGNDFWLSRGFLQFNANVGLLIGGNIGIVWVDGTELLANGSVGGGAQVRIDNSLNATGGIGNAGAIFSDTTHFDGLQTNGAYALEVNDTLIAGGNIVVNGTIGSSTLDNIHVTSWPNSTIYLNGRNFNALRDGIRVSDATTKLAIGAAGSVDSNGGYGVNATVATTGITSWGRTFSNTTADYSPNTGLVNPYAAAAAYTPVVTCGSGAITTYTATGFAMPVGNTKLEQVSGTVAVTTNGTCATSLNVTLPTTAKRTTSGPVGRETVTSGAGLIGVLTATSNVMAIVTVANAYPAVNGSNIQFNFTYERE